MQIEFLGAANVVTGSNILITTHNHKILLDCGMFQGSEALESLNHEAFAFNPAEIDFLFLSHAHIDHSGRIPKLVKEGFRGKILCTQGTKDLCDIMLADSGHIQENDTEWENKKRRRSGLPLLKPLYTASDALFSLPYFEPVLYDQKIDLDGEISVRFRDAGHILGSSIIEIWIEENGDTVKIVFSGDLGMKGKPLIRDPEIIEEADYLILESTYGNENHKSIENRIKRLTDIINKTVLRGGTVLIPSFAVGRTQELIYELKQYYETNKDLDMSMRIPIYIDSPMAINATEIFKKNSYCFDEEAKNIILSGDNPLDFDNLYFIRDYRESMALNNSNFPKVVISASGMCTAGRIRHHLKHNLWKEKNSLVFVGYQAEGTLGRILKDGAKSVKLLGETIAVFCEVYSVEGFSGHADQRQLIQWLKGFNKKPKKIFLVHGEEDSLKGLAQSIKSEINVSTIIPNMGYIFQMKNDVLRAYSGEILDPIKRKDNIKKELNGLSQQIESLVSKSYMFIDDKTLEKKYYELKNKLIELQKELLDLGMILGDKR